MPDATAETNSTWLHCLQRQTEYYLGEADTRGILSDLPDSVFAILPWTLGHRLTSLTHQIGNLAQLY